MTLPTLTYVVRLQNAGPADIVLDAVGCPSYSALLGDPDLRQVAVKDLHQLNCPGVTLRPGRPVDFAMRMAIPPEVRDGAYTIFWNLNLVGATGSVAATAKADIHRRQ